MAETIRAVIEQHNPVNIYKNMIANGTMDIKDGYSGAILGNIKGFVAGDRKYISYEEFKANNYTTGGMPDVATEAPLKNMYITTFFGAKGDLSILPHRGNDLRASKDDVTPIFTNSTTKATVFGTEGDLNSIQGYHADLETQVSYMFKGQQRIDTVTQRMLHLDSINIMEESTITISTVLGKSGNTGYWNGTYADHLHDDVSVGKTGSPWLQYLTMQAQQNSTKYSIGNPYTYDNMYYDPMIFYYKYIKGTKNDAAIYSR